MKLFKIFHSNIIIILVENNSNQCIKYIYRHQIFKNLFRLVHTSNKIGIGHYVSLSNSLSC